MKTSRLRYAGAVTIGPHLDQSARDLLDDQVVADGEVIGSGGAAHAEAVTAS